MSKDHERIWLEPAGAPDRCWCQDNQWGEDGVEYVLASETDRLQRENAELRAWQAGALSCREAEQARIDDYKRELEEALCAQDIATREQTAAFGIAQARAEVAEAEVMRLRALSVVGEPPFEFDRYISGALMAEGVRIEKIETLEKAIVVAAKVASRGPNGEVPILIMRPLSPSTTK